MAPLSKLRTCQSTCSYYIKTPGSAAEDVGCVRTAHIGTTTSSRMQVLRVHFVVIDDVIFIFEGLVGGVRSEAEERQKERRKEKGGESELIFEWHSSIAIAKEG